MRLKRRLVYAVNDLLRLFRFQILSTDETLDLLLTTDVSLARFGDGEMAIMLEGISISNIIIQSWRQTFPLF